MIYLDNAATTKEKPKEVFEAFQEYIENIGVSPGRGSYSLGIAASRMLYQSRKVVGEYFGLKEASDVIFTKNSTEAINVFVNSIMGNGGHAIITCFEHNAVLRPLHKLKEKGIIDYSIIRIDDLEKSPSTIIDKYIRPDTKVFMTTLASNITGRIVFRSELLKAFKDKKVLTFVDASQGAGTIRIDMANQGVDFLAFTGHKDLMALPGVGGLCCGDKDIITPLIQGGTGIFGDSYVNPQVFPEGIEAGTLNMPAIWSLKKAIEYIDGNSEGIREREKKMINLLIKELSEIEYVEIYDRDKDRVGTVGFNIKGKTSNEVVRILDREEICVRGGIHCAITTHEALGTVKTGIVRISIGAFTTEDEINTIINVIKEMGRK